MGLPGERTLSPAGQLKKIEDLQNIERLQIFQDAF
jgi:hypothetical protein